jgi:excisionase family DNA binding protein
MGIRTKQQVNHKRKNKIMRLVSIKIVAEFLMIKQSTLYSWVHNGSIPFHKLNGLVRFDMDEIKSWVKMSKQTQGSIGPIVRKAPSQDIDKIIKNAIDSTQRKEYNPSNGKPGQMQGLRKEV